MKGIVTIVGRPNVGKSTLFNRLIGSRKALVLDTPGVTRDRNYEEADWYGRTFLVVDTGGFDPSTEEGMFPLMREQAQLAIDEADAILFILDGRDGLTPTDREVFQLLRKAQRPVFVVVNKIDSKKQDGDALEFHALGVETIFPISAEHGIGVSDLMEEVVHTLPVQDDAEDPDSGTIRVAVVGRPNVGKSTLVNRLLGDNRLLTADRPGTTRDAIDTELTVGDKRYVLIDTAGVRRKRSIALALEKFSVIKAFQAIERADVVIVMTDSTEGFTDQDARIANMAIEHGRALVIACNKWDVVEKDSKTADTFVKDFHGDRPSLAFVPVVFISALTGQRAHRILQLVDTVYDNWNRRIPTGQLNRWFEETTSRTPPPLHLHRAVRFYYITQARSAPPTFIVQTNMPGGVQTAYKRFLKNQFRDNFMFEGSPIRLVMRQRGKKNKRA